VGLSTLLVPVICGGIVLSLLMIAFNDQVLPRANHRLRTLQSDIARKKPTFALRARVVNEVSPGKLYLVAGRIDQATNKMREVVIYDLGDPARRRTIYADSGVMAMTPAGDLALTLFSGSIQVIKKAELGELQRVFYVTNRVLVSGVGNQLSRSTNDTYKSEREMSICELQRVVADNQRALDESRAEVTRTLVTAVRAATTGAPVASPPRPPPAAQPYGRRWSLARAYCQGVAPIFGVQAGQYQASGGNPPPPAALRSHAPAQSSPTSRSTARPGSPPRLAQSPAPAPSVQPQRAASAAPTTNAGPIAPPSLALAALTSTVEGTRARIETDQRTQWTYDVEVQKKFAIAMACVVFVILGTPIALRFPRGGVGLVIGVSFGVFALYYVGLIAGEPLAQNGKVSPFLAMWCSNIAFTIVGIYMLAHAGRVGASTRSGDWSEFRDAMRARLSDLARRIGIPAERRQRLPA
jgi:lipopolysaccharide export system permease protein